MGEDSTLNLKLPSLCSLTFKTAIIERYRRRESSVEEALVEMYFAGVSVNVTRTRTSTSAVLCGPSPTSGNQEIAPHEEVPLSCSRSATPSPCLSPTLGGECCRKCPGDQIAINEVDDSPLDHA